MKFKNSKIFILKIREEEKNYLPQMKQLFFLYVWLNLTRIAELCKENLVKHIRKRTIQTGRLFFSSSLMMNLNLSFIIHHSSFIVIFFFISCNEAQKSSSPISGEYGKHVILAYNELTQEISGIYQSQINTNEAASDSCYFYFVGKFAGEKTNIISWRIGHRMEEIFGVMTMRDSLSFDLSFEKNHIHCDKNQHSNMAFTLNKKTDWRYIRTIKKDGVAVYGQQNDRIELDTILRKGTIIKVTDKKIDWVKTSANWWIREQDVIRFPG